MAPLLERLYARGCRVWYPTARAETVALHEQRNARMGEARLLVLYQTRHARTDQSVKSAVLVCQAKGIPVISIDTDNEKSALSMGLDARAVHVRERGINALETALLHSEGFSQALIGPPQTVHKRRLWGIAAAVFAAALLLAGAAVLYRHLRPPAIEQASDTVFFSDPVLTQAVRDALDRGLITEESIRTVTVLRFDTLPANTDEFALLLNLSRIEIDQANAHDALPLLDRYEIVLTGGEP